jgi:hypothetical protein
MGYFGGKPATYPRVCPIQRSRALSSSTALAITTIPRIGRPVMSKAAHWLGGRSVHVLRADPRDKPIAIDAHGQVATGHESQATEHRPLADSGDMLEADADPTGQQFVKTPWPGS